MIAHQSGTGRIPPGPALLCTYPGWSDRLTPDEQGRPLNFEKAACFGIGSDSKTIHYDSHLCACGSSFQGKSGIAAPVDDAHPNSPSHSVLCIGAHERPISKLRDVNAGQVQLRGLAAPDGIPIQHGHHLFAAQRVARTEHASAIARSDTVGIGPQNRIMEVSILGYIFEAARAIGRRSSGPIQDSDQLTRVMTPSGLNTLFPTPAIRPWAAT